jgi:hypothetical protein
MPANPNDVMLSARAKHLLLSEEKADSSVPPQNDIQRSMQFMQPVFDEGSFN